ncbi:MAG: Enoyl-CoA hydratase/isomerase family protein, partial [uncultured Acidimicrobiales bacterium]
AERRPHRRAGRPGGHPVAGQPGAAQRHGPGVLDRPAPGHGRARRGPRSAGGRPGRPGPALHGRPGPSGHGRPADRRRGGRLVSGSGGGLPPGGDASPGVDHQRRAVLEAGRGRRARRLHRSRSRPDHRMRHPPLLGRRHLQRPRDPFGHGRRRRHPSAPPPHRRPGPCRRAGPHGSGRRRREGRRDRPGERRAGRPRQPSRGGHGPGRRDRRQRTTRRAGHKARAAGVRGPLGRRRPRLRRRLERRLPPLGRPQRGDGRLLREAPAAVPGHL